MSHWRQQLVSPNFRILTVISRQAFCNLEKQALSHGRQYHVSPNYRIFVYVISSQIFCNLGGQAHVAREINIVSPNYRMFAWRWNKKLQKYNLLLSAIDYTLHQVVCHPTDNTNNKHFNLCRNLKNINIS